MSKLSALSSFWVLAIVLSSVVTKAETISFPLARPAFTQQAHEQFLRYKALLPLNLGDVSGKSCPQQVAVVRNIFNRIMKANNLEQFLTVDPGLEISIGCIDKNIDSTGLRLGGFVSFPGVIVGKLPDEDQIAFILGHEISHYLLAHDELRIHWKQIDKMITAEENQNTELQADALGLQLIAAAGYDPYASIDVMKFLLRLKGSCFFGFCLEDDSSSHSSEQNRMRLLLSKINEQNYVRKKRTTTPDLELAHKEWKQLVK